jgi:hypothetical protein
MNTVLDDNCTLCLPNGERIKLNPVTMRMLFEVQDLAVASPATVSRCGMVYISHEELGWRPYVQTWLQQTLPKVGVLCSYLELHQLSPLFLWLLACLNAVVEVFPATITAVYVC